MYNKECPKSKDFLWSMPVLGVLCPDNGLFGNTICGGLPLPCAARLPEPVPDPPTVNHRGVLSLARE